MEAFLIRPADVRQSMLGRDEPEHADRDRMYAPQIATVTAVYPVAHPENRTGQTLVDILPQNRMAPWRKVPLCASYAHGETDIAVPNTRRRQPKPPKARGQMEGLVRDVRPGTRVLVMFPSGDMRAPLIVGTLKFNAQGAGGFPSERVGVDYFDDSGNFKMEEENPVDSLRTEFPRSRDTFNGSTHQVDNRGNMTRQTTIDRDPIFPGHNHIPPSPTPQGNLVDSTRGAKKGRIGRITGRHELTNEQSEDGTIRDETREAMLGNAIVKLMSDVGRYWLSTVGSGDGRVYLEDVVRSYLSFDSEGKVELGGRDKVALDGRVVCLGNDDPPFHADLHEPLNQFIQQVVMIFDMHTHTAVTTGSDNSGPPANLLTPVYAAAQFGANWKSEVVKLCQDESPHRNTEDDPDGGS